MKKYFLLIVEGIDGAGKTCLIDNFFKGKNNIITKTLEEMQVYGALKHVKGLSDGYYGKQIREVLAKDQLTQEDKVKLYELFTADSLDIFKRLEDFEGIVIMDRSPFSQACYQTAVKTQEEILRDYFINYPTPDVLIYLKITPTVAMKRLTSSRSSLDCFETKENLENVYKNYEKMIPQLKTKFKVIIT